MWSLVCRSFRRTSLYFAERFFLKKVVAHLHLREGDYRWVQYSARECVRFCRIMINFEEPDNVEQLAEMIPPPTEDDLPTPQMTCIQYSKGGSYNGYMRGEDRHGHGVYIDRHGNRYEGSWDSDKAHGYGKKEFCKTGDVHEGYYEKDKRHGWGMYHWANGDKYVGSWSRGIMHGEGTFMWARGDVYQGSWVDGKMRGKGVKKLSNGDVYDGFWKDDKAEGYGIKRFACGDVHEGNYAQDHRAGCGLYTWPNGDRFEGHWIAGKMNGRGRKAMANGDVYVGEWTDDKADGRGVKIFACGDRHEGEYKQDQRHGFGTYEWSTGIRTKGHGAVAKCVASVSSAWNREMCMTACGKTMPHTAGESNILRMATSMRESTTKTVAKGTVFTRGAILTCMRDNGRKVSSVAVGCISTHMVMCSTALGATA